MPIFREKLLLACCFWKFIWW